MPAVLYFAGIKSEAAIRDEPKLSETGIDEKHKKVKKDTNVEITRLHSSWMHLSRVGRHASMREKLACMNSCMMRQSRHEIRPTAYSPWVRSKWGQRREKMTGSRTKQLDNGIDRTEQNSIGQVEIGVYIRTYIQDLEHSLSLSYYYYSVLSCLSCKQSLFPRLCPVSRA